MQNLSTSGKLPSVIENSISLLPTKPGGQISENLCAVVFSQDQDAAQELTGLLSTLSVVTKDQLIAPIRNINIATYLGKGLIEQKLKPLVFDHAVDFVAMDLELSPQQVKHCQDLLGVPVLDRPAIIIEIFSRNAKTKEAKTQVAMARLKYLLPRLAHLWSHFERQQGGGAISRGMGEKQIEVDRRLIKNRLVALQSELDLIHKERQNRRKGRKNFYKIALVGYTNAGKSTLLNALTHSNVLVENKLFATLDSSARVLDPVSSPPVIMLDTVGFIHRLPPSLVASFRSTIEEIFEADLLVHVIDASHVGAISQKKVTQQILEEMGLGDKPVLLVLNKADLIKSPQQRNRIKAGLAQSGSEIVLISSKKPEDLLKLREAMLKIVQQDLITVELMIPYDQAQLEAKLYEFGQVDQKRYLEKGVFFKVKMESKWFKKWGLQKYQL
jgi:GTP-binding protein HflX